MTLSATAVRNAKPRNKAFKLSDGGGLFLFVAPNGGRYWRMGYRYDGKQKVLSFGVFPDVSLADARELRDRARKLLAKGIDPSVQARLDKIAASIASANTFAAVAEEWIEKITKDGLAEVTLKKIRWLVNQILPAIGTRPIAEISAPELLMALRKLEAKGRYDTAQRLRSTCGQIFRYAIATSRAERDISNDLRGALIAHKVTHLAAILKPTEAGALLRSIETFEGHVLTKTALRLLPHVFVRPGELRHAEWSEFDLDGAVWTIPAPLFALPSRPRMALGPTFRVLVTSVTKLVKSARPVKLNVPTALVTCSPSPLTSMVLTSIEARPMFTSSTGRVRGSPTRPASTFW